MKQDPSKPVDLAGARLLGGKESNHGTMPWDPTDSDLVRTKACPFTSGPVVMPVMDAGNVGMKLGVKYIPCNRKCALFVREDAHPDKGYCAFVPPFLAGGNVAPAATVPGVG